MRDYLSLSCWKIQRLCATLRGAENKTKSFSPFRRLACRNVLTLPDSVTAIAFVPVVTGNSQHYHLAAGLDNGQIVLVRWIDTAENVGQEEEWTILQTLDCNAAHHKTVKRLKFRPTSNENNILLASCSSDHSAKLFRVNL